MRHILTTLLVLATGLLNAQRLNIPLNTDWQFTKDSSAKWQPVSLPHTWNIEDVMDDVPSYYRGVGWYKKKLVLDKKLQDKTIYLFFEAANQEATVYVNGKAAGSHTGGYTAFNVNITSLLNWNGENELLVKVDNSFNANIPPLSADFTFYGGLYRQVSLVAVNPIHCNAVFISTPVVTNSNAVVQVKADLSAKANGFKLVTIIYDAAGNKVAAGGDRITISNPRLWSPEKPYLYKAVTRIISEKGVVLDELTNPLGFRWFHFDAAKGFFLNGKPYKLVGTSRHQDYQGMGNAVPAELARKDVQLLKKMGGNFLRVAHYPQDPVVLKVCDSLGILASVEIPVVNEITESDSFYDNCLNMQLEMIRQSYNHPSVIIWCSMNEVLLRPHYNNDKEKQKIYFAAIAKLAKRLDSLTRKEDPYRYTMIAYHGDYNRYREVGLIDIPMIAGWNLYSGWYGATISEFPVFLDKFHKDYPAMPMVVSEYGADADPRIRSVQPVRFDKSVEYTTKFHQYYMNEMMKRPFVAAAMIWNLADFNSETRTESMPHINNKGLLTWDRTPKDPYYYYQAVLLKTPFIKILGTQPAEGLADSSKSFCLRSLQVASNAKSLELFFNGRSAGKQNVENGLCEWKVPFVHGNNIVEVKGIKDGKLYTDKSIIPFCVQPYKFDDSKAVRPMNILLGANRYFTDEQQQVWIPDQEYREGSWGHVGGKAFKITGNNRLPYGTDKSIAGTNDDPVYQTQQIGIEKYRLDLPAGEYEITLHFAELVGGRIKELAYNLPGNERIEPNGERIFNVYVNGKLVLDSFNISSEYGAATAITKTIRLNVDDKDGVEIYFQPIQGEPVLNAIQVISAKQPWNSKFIKERKNGTIEYVPDAFGNIIPDFSGVGYLKNRKPLPQVKIVKTVSPQGGDDQQLIQTAIDEVSQMKPDKDGFRGTILLKKGRYKIWGNIKIRTSGIILRGEGDETVLIAAGKGQRALISVNSSGEIKEMPGSRRQITDRYVPVGAKSFSLTNTKGLKVGDSIIMFRPATKKWIADIQMDQIERRDSTSRQWDTAEYGLHYERVITKIQGNKIFIDNPVVMAMEEQYGGGEIYKYSFPGRIRNVGIENLLCESEYSGNEDEDHGWDAIHFNRIVNGWVTKVTAKYFGYSCVNLGYQARNITVSYCKYLEPKSKITGSRRYSFNNDGQLNLFMHCFASEGRHDYVTGARVCGPNVFYDCRSENAKADIGPHHRWATGTLFDNIITDGEINIQDRGNWGTGHGWAGVNQVVWNCTVKRAAIQNPWASANNYVIGLKGEKYEGRLKGRPDAIWEGQNKAELAPVSLYLAQLKEAK